MSNKRSNLTETAERFGDCDSHIPDELSSVFREFDVARITADQLIAKLEVC